MCSILKLTDDWEQIKPKSKLILYGMGRIGRRILPTLMNEFSVPYLIDGKQSGSEILGLKVLNLPQAAEQLKKEKIKIVVTTVMASYTEIAAELEKYGFHENEDFCYFERFAGEWNLRWRNRCVLSKIDTVITSRCTLKCQNCNMFIGHVTEPQDISFESLKNNFDLFFDSVDFVYEYTLLGGEPFLHKDLKEIISYLGDKYGDRIGQINLISNGTVLPSEEVMKTLVRYHVTVHISDYTCSVPCEEKLKKVTEGFSKYNVVYYIIPNNTWKDVIYPNMTYSIDNPREHMLLCGHSTHSVDYGKLYWCDPAFAAEHFTNFPSKVDDSLDLLENKRNNSKQEASLNIFRYLMGDVNERGYMSICEKCAGVGKDNQRIVTAGVQLKTGKLQRSDF